MNQQLEIVVAVDACVFVDGHVTRNDSTKRSAVPVG